MRKAVKYVMSHRKWFAASKSVMKPARKSTQLTTKSNRFPGLAQYVPKDVTDSLSSTSTT
eukprot:CAMPEP_0183414816 /NCGR_PEP_ID=MMETSP0370-20130417/22657_1 /TAXON_ID=268820 /ORGANISM="Peridinium aciculiferum, Strain PAER-2" /LENGTH=59 /DNA_ID=CAMNT_0025598173 /DNA_START=55 /DNA_END=234 /DNA_ORIENTATION=-